jgi:hypothetical protein
MKFPFTQPLNEMFHINEQYQLVKTSNGELVPRDEPLFILRGRDQNAVLTLMYYAERCGKTGTPDDRLRDLMGVIEKFKRYAEEHPTKIPGSSHGR